ncbi:MAG: hypothetical protein BGO49_11485 [Planctomycetales bacterium 71-10]|nr:MAG: hypothetical protein BGO49_11485 [Planctomycetales bacterium 71-10]
MALQAGERVAVALDLVAMDRTIDDGEIDPGSALAQPQFFDHQCVTIGLVLGEKPIAQDVPDVDVFHRHNSIA